MQELLNDFRCEQLHFRRTIIFSMILVVSLVLTAVFYLDAIKSNKSNGFNGVSMITINNYSFTAQFVSTTTDSITFKLKNGSDDQTYFAYLDEKTINKLTPKTKLGDTIKIYSKTVISEDKNGFLISRVENVED